jgi:hypothetical protein
MGAEFGYLSKTLGEMELATNIGLICASECYPALELITQLTCKRVYLAWWYWGTRLINVSIDSFAFSSCAKKLYNVQLEVPNHKG